MNNIELKYSDIEEDILKMFLFESRHNDSHRFLANFRGPSKLQHRIMDDLSKLYAGRRENNA